MGEFENARAFKVLSQGVDPDEAVGAEPITLFNGDGTPFGSSPEVEFTAADFTFPENISGSSAIFTIKDGVAYGLGALSVDVGTLNYFSIELPGALIPRGQERITSLALGSGAGKRFFYSIYGVEGVCYMEVSMVSAADGDFIQNSVFSLSDIRYLVAT